MSLTEMQRYQLKKLVRQLSQYRGRHTELVTVYIPQGYDLNKIIGHLSQEQGTASNIKSATTRNNVQTALERMIQHLRLYKKTPDHGLAVFSGNIAEREGTQDFEVWSIEPPVPIKTRIYRCDKAFQLEILQDMLDIKEAYGLVVVDRRDANIAILKGKNIIPKSKTHSQVPGKFRAGGQSAQRFERQREDAVRAHLKKVADHMKEEFLGKKGIKGIILGGPGPVKYELAEGGYITGDLQKKIIGIKDLSYTGDFGLQELLDKSQDILANEEVANEKKIVGRFFELLNKKPNMVVYGEKQVIEQLKNGVCELVMLSETVEEEIIDKFSEEAKKFNTEVAIISVDTREGVQLQEIGKVAGILRYEIHQE
jgi:peptide chain release factor subunit 1